MIQPNNAIIRDDLVKYDFFDLNTYDAASATLASYRTTNKSFSFSATDPGFEIPSIQAVKNFNHCYLIFGESLELVLQTSNIKYETRGKYFVESTIDGKSYTIFRNFSLSDTYLLPEVPRYNLKLPSTVFIAGFKISSSDFDNNTLPSENATANLSFFASLIYTKYPIIPTAGLTQ